MAGIRRTWDKDYYAQKAKQRLEAGDEVETDKKKHSKSSREEFKAADKDAAGPMGSDRAFLNARQSKVDLDSKVGKVEVIKPGEGNSSHGPGFWCEVCQCLLKDSAGYLNHINGKNHQRALGYSMRVERVDADRVKERLDSLKRKVSANATNSIEKMPAIEEYDLRVAERILEEDMEKKKRKEEKIMKKREQEARELEGVDSDIASMMGFGGFGSSKFK